MLAVFTLSPEGARNDHATRTAGRRPRPPEDGRPPGPSPRPGLTAAARLRGAVFADQLAARGFSLALAGRDRARLDAAARRVGHIAPDGEPVVGDLGADDGHLDGRAVDALGSDVSHTAIYRRLAAPEPVVVAGLRVLDRGHAAVVPGWRDRLMATGGRILPGRLSALVSGERPRPTEGAGSKVRS